MSKRNMIVALLAVAPLFTGGMHAAVPNPKPNMMRMNYADLDGAGTDREDME